MCVIVLSMQTSVWSLRLQLYSYVPNTGEVSMCAVKRRSTNKKTNLGFGFVFKDGHITMHYRMIHTSQAYKQISW